MKNSTTDMQPTSNQAASLAITVNGESYAATAGSSVLELVASLGFAGRPLAVEVNEQIIPRAHLGSCLLQASDRIEIVTLVGGG
jgi:sulfur carrier protein